MFDDIKLRSLSALILASVSFLILYLGGLYLKIFLSLVLIILNFEWMRIVSQNKWIIRGIISILFSTLVFFNDGFISMDLVLIASSILIISSLSSFFNAPSFWSSFGFIYILVSLSVIQWIRDMESGLIVLFLIISTIIISDISGYVFGKTISGPKIFKKISPNKTYSGFFSSLILGSLWFSLILSFISDKPFLFNLAIGLLIVLFSIAGDLLLSFLKRKTNLKDSGNILPGHGGMFDRADSILAVFFLLLPLLILFGYLDNPLGIIVG